MFTKKNLYITIIISLVAITWYFYPKNKTIPKIRGEYKMEDITVPTRPDIVSSQKLHITNSSEISILHSDQIEQLCHSEDVFVRQMVARNSKLSQKTLDILVVDRDNFVRQILAQRQDLTKQLLRKLAQDKDWFVRSLVAKNINTDLMVLQFLSNDSQLEVRWSVARNSNINSFICKNLASDHKEIRRQLVNNPALPFDILESFKDDKDEYVRSVALHRSKMIIR